ncbi:MAG: response regulator [Bacteroidales bacterium]|nr:response regulator [Bacteroidales bacterium]
MEDLKLDLSKYSILVVDDVPLNVMLVEKMLSRFGFRILKAENGLEAMREILAQKPDLVFLVILMPIMDGFQTLEQIRKNPELSDVRVVVLSALNSNEDIVKAYNLGANDFITKPIMLDKLINSVAKQLGIKI